MILEVNYLHICEEICLHLLQGKYNDGIDQQRMTGYKRTRPRPALPLRKRTQVKKVKKKENNSKKNNNERK